MKFCSHWLLTGDSRRNWQGFLLLAVNYCELPSNRCGLKIIVSSAYWIKSQFSMTDCCMSLTWMLKKSGPRTVHCGTPWYSWIQSELHVDRLTSWYLSVGKLFWPSHRNKDDAIFLKRFDEASNWMLWKCLKMLLLCFDCHVDPFLYFPKRIVTHLLLNSLLGIQIAMSRVTSFQGICSFVLRISSKTFATEDVVDNGLKLPGSSLSPFLWIGITWACFRCSGNLPSPIKAFIMKQSGFSLLFCISFEVVLIYLLSGLSEVLS